MPRGGIISRREERGYGGRITPFVLFTCIVAATGGLIFGYDIGVSGGVTSMDVFLKKFFPSVYKTHMEESTSKNEYCTFDSQLLTSFTSSLYLAALVASFFASSITRIFGRKTSMFLGGLTFLVGASFNGFALNLTMLIFGRLLLGVGIGFANQSVPLYLSEMAPAKLRGALNIGFQLAITIGIFAANLINFGTSKIKGDYGWRISLALAVVPAIIITIGSLILPDTPNSLIERGQREQAKTILQKIRGTNEVDPEFQDLVEACEQSSRVQHPWKNILERRYRPQLVMAIFIPFLQQFTGINVIMFYAPVLFKTLGYGDDASLISAVITGIVNMVATLVSIFSVDHYGRRFLFLEGGLQMFLCQILVGTLIGKYFGMDGIGSLPKLDAHILVVLICIYVAGFAWSWGPLGWLVPSEIFPLEIRSVGQSITVSVNMLFTFIIAQVFLSMLCHLKFGLFFFFAGWEVLMTIFIYFFLPETKNVPIEEMNLIWKQHWFWRKYIPEEASLRGESNQEMRSTV